MKCNEQCINRQISININNEHLRSQQTSTNIVHTILSPASLCRWQLSREVWRLAHVDSTKRIFCKTIKKRGYKNQLMVTWVVNQSKYCFYLFGLFGGWHATLGWCILATVFVSIRMEKAWKGLGAQSRASALVTYASLHKAITIDIHIYTCTYIYYINILYMLYIYIIYCILYMLYIYYIYHILYIYYYKYIYIIYTIYILYK